jgi:hypothetical protein
LIDLESDSGLKRFVAAANASWRKQRWLRETRLDHLKQIAGQWYGENCAAESVPAPFLSAFLETIVNNLAAGTPEVQITTPIPELKSAAYDLQLGVNQALEEMNFKTWAQRTLREALVGVGVIVVGVSPFDRGFDEKAGDVFAETVDPDDWIQDVTAKVWEHSKFYGYRVRTPVADIIDDPGYDEEWRNDLAKQPRHDDREDGIERASDIGTPKDSVEDEECEDSIDVWRFYLPREGLIAYFPGTRNGVDDVVEAKLVRLEDNVGPRTGPFEVLALGELPGNCLPVPLVSKIRDLHDQLNALENNNAEDAVSERKVLGYEGREAAADVERMLDAPRNDAIRLDKLDKVKPFQWGGASPASLAAADRIRSQINYYSGNIEAVGGQAVQADTLGQERIIKESASVQINAIRRAFYDFVLRCVKQIAFYELTDPLMDRLVERRIEGTSRVVTTHLTPTRLDRLQGRFHELNFKIKPFSTEARTPEEDFQQLERLVASLGQSAPIFEILAMQGINFNFDGYLRTGARSLGIEHFIDDCFDFSGPPRIPTQGMRGSDPRTPLATTRTSVRTTVQPQQRAAPTDPMAAIADLAKAQAAAAPQGAVA